MPPESSLTLLTSVLGASANWLLLRHLYSALRSEDSGDTGVVLVSFMRDGTFWREGAAKLVSLPVLPLFEREREREALVVR